MAEIIIPGPAGRLEAKYYKHPQEHSPIALILHPHPQPPEPFQGGTMDNKITYALYQAFVQQGFNTLRFNFRGVGKSQGEFDHGEGELGDAAAALDWLERENKNARTIWVAGFSFGAWIAMQLLMRRPEIEGFIAVSPPANKYDFNFLAPCPVSGQMIQGTNDDIVDIESVRTLATKLSNQRGIKIDLREIQGADHFFTNKVSEISNLTKDYLEKKVPSSV